MCNSSDFLQVPSLQLQSFLRVWPVFSVLILVISVPPEIIKICFSLLQVLSRIEMSTEKSPRLLEYLLLCLGR